MPDRCFSHPFFKTSSDRDYSTKHHISEKYLFPKSPFQQHISIQCHIEICMGSTNMARCDKCLPSCPCLHYGSQSYTSFSCLQGGFASDAFCPFPQHCGFLWRGVPTEPVGGPLTACVCRDLSPVSCTHGPFPWHRAVRRLPRATRQPSPNLLGSLGTCLGD